jgi:hypothetical protein
LLNTTITITITTIINTIITTTIIITTTTTTITIITITNETLAEVAPAFGWARFMPLGVEPPGWRAHPFGFPWQVAVSLRNPRFELLDLFGFPWILSSESRLFNGLREINAEKFFAPLFPLGSASS